MANPIETRMALDALRVRPLPERIKGARELFGWTQEILLECWMIAWRQGWGVPHPPLRCTVSNWERGHCTPYAKNRQALAFLFGVEGTYFNP